MDDVHLSRLSSLHALHPGLLVVMISLAACALAGAEPSTIFQAIDACLSGERGEALAAFIGHTETVNQRDTLGRTPLIYLIEQAGDAVESGDSAAEQQRAALTARLADMLIAHSADLNRADASGSPPLHLALAQQQRALARALIEHGADVNAVDGKGRTPVMVAVEAVWPQADLVAALLTHGARAEIRTNVSGAEAEAPPSPLATAITARIKALDDVRQGIKALFGGPDPSARAAAWLTIIASLLDAHARPDLMVVSPSGFPWPALHVAVRAGDIETARLLISHGAEATGIADNGPGLMGCAVDSARPEMVGFLAGLGLSPDEIDAQGNPVACRVEDPGMLAALLNAGAKADGRRGDRRTLLHLAAEADNPELIATLLAHGAALNPVPEALKASPAESRPDARGWIIGKTPLWLALEQHRPHAVLALLQRGAAVRLRLSDGTTALHLAATWSGALLNEQHADAPGGLPADAVSLIRLLIAEGADPDARTAKPANGRALVPWNRNPLHCACLAHSLDAAQTLLALHADATLLDSDGKPPWRLALDDDARRGEWLSLFRSAGIAIAESDLRPFALRAAIVAGDGERSDALLAADSSLIGALLPIRLGDAEAAPPLHLAIATRQPAMVTRLLAHQADLAQRDSRGRPALVRAVESGQSDLVRLLVEHGADANAPTQSEGVEGSSPLLIALGRFPGGAAVRDPTQQLAMLNLLLELGADPDRAVGKDHCPLEVAVAAGNLAAVQALLARGARVDFSDSAGRNLLHALAWNSAKGLDIAELLIAKGVDPNHADSPHGETPLHRAARSAKGPAVQWLLAHGAHRDASDARHGTPLHVAAEAGNLSALTTLIAAGAPLDATDQDGATPLVVAIEAAQGDSVARLLEHHASGAETEVAVVRGWLHLKQGQHYKLKALLDQEPAIATGRLIRGQTLLMRAADRQDAIALRLLLDHAADPNALDGQGRTALMHAVLNTSAEDPAVVALLLKAGAEPTRTDQTGATALALMIAKHVPPNRPRSEATQKIIALLGGAGVERNATPPHDPR